MLMHFGMSGSLAYFKSPEEEPSHSGLLFAFENGYHLPSTVRGCSAR
jgi:hypothetical protein